MNWKRRMSKYGHALAFWCDKYPATASTVVLAVLVILILVVYRWVG